MTRKQKKMLIRILLSALLLGVLLLLPVKGWWRFGLFLIPYLIIGYDILLRAVKGIIKLQPFDENFLMAVATVGAIALGEYTEGVAVMLFYQIGEWFQSYAVGKSRRSIGALMDIRPETANLEGVDGEVTECAPEEVAVGSILVVRPGEKIPIDGVVESGVSSLNTVSLTGESLPRDVKEGESVISGCINLTGVLRIRTTRAFGESTVSKILDLVENASSKKSRSERFISKFARIYTPAVCISALLLAVLPPLVLLLFKGDPLWGVWIKRALTFLVISCPCALVISVPLTFFAGIGGASRAGVLIKGSNYLETLARVKTIAFDKTGTLSAGLFDVVEVQALEGEEKALLETAALAEYYSTHPIAECLRRAVGETLDAARVSDIREHSGKGILARVDGAEIAVGNARLMEALGIRVLAREERGTVVYLAREGRYIGHILIADRIKPSAPQAVAELHRMGVKKTVMLTGDRRAVAAEAAAVLGIRDVSAELLPQDKLEVMEGLLQNKRSGEAVAFAGDGINDAPVLSRADVGIAMGALGSDAAIEAADVVLMDDDPRKIATAICISKKCMRIVRENIWLALGVKALCLLLGALGIGGMWLAVFADVGVMVLAVLNAIRAMRVEQKK